MLSIIKGRKGLSEICFNRTVTFEEVTNSGMELGFHIGVLEILAIPPPKLSFETEVSSKSSSLDAPFLHSMILFRG